MEDFKRLVDSDVVRYIIYALVVIMLIFYFIPLIVRGSKEGFKQGQDGYFGLGYALSDDPIKVPYGYKIRHLGTEDTSTNRGERHTVHNLEKAEYRKFMGVDDFYHDGDDNYWTSSGPTEDTLVKSLNRKDIEDTTDAQLMNNIW